MARKVREPKILTFDDLVTWSKDLVEWLGEHSGDSDFTPRGADFTHLSVAYKDAYNATIKPKQYAPLLHEELKHYARMLVVILRELRMRIPLLPGIDVSVLANFGLGEHVPTDWDKLHAVAQICKEYWLGLLNPPEYAHLTSRMTEMVRRVDEFDAKHSAYRMAIGEKQDAINYRDERRTELLACEREIFKWYYAAHKRGHDDWWRTTPWGETAAGKLPAPEDFVHDGEEFSWNTVEDATNYELQCRITGGAGRWTKLYEGVDNHTAEKPAEPGKYDFRVRAIAITRRGKWSETLTIVI